MIDEYEVHTEGGTEEGGPAAIITIGTAADPVVIETIMKREGKYICSYEEERFAIREALKWMLVNQKHDDTVSCSDSQALLTSIET